MAFVVTNSSRRSSRDTSLTASPSFKTVMLVRKCLYTTWRHRHLCVRLRLSSSIGLTLYAISEAVMVPLTRTSTGQRSFSVMSPEPGIACNLDQPQLSSSTFKRQAKTQSSSTKLVTAGCNCASRIAKIPQDLFPPRILVTSSRGCHENATRMLRGKPLQCNLSL